MHTILSTLLPKLKHRGIQVLLVVAVYILIADFLPLRIHQEFYSISLLIKDMLVWILPITVGLFIAHTICSFHRHAPLFVLSLIVFEALSNLSSVWYAFGAGHLVADYLPPIKLSTVNTDFSPLWRLPFIKPSWWSADKGTFFGLFLGSVAAISKNVFLKQIISEWKERAEWILTRIFSRLIPLFILGFVARLDQTHILHYVFAHYGVLLIWLLLFLSVYILFLFFMGSDKSLRGLFNNVNNVLPAGGIAFSSGCSLSTMPWTIAGAAKNLRTPSLAQAIIPATTNIQQIGDCIANTFLCFLIYRHFYGHNPDLITWINFSIVFVLARFATAAIIGGAIFIMLPIYEAYLGFNPEMIAIILAFNVILDPIITSSNVMANGALCRIFEKGWTALLRTPLAYTNSKKEKPLK